ncbi:hypothetical protein LQZ19_11005 [Treponema primitia]|uniref:hypothetical protein n=1 Tax=Treponema primitia TaxID=88058 RepID=UPI0039805B35
MSSKYLKWTLPILCGLFVLIGCPTPGGISDDFVLTMGNAYSVSHPNSISVTNYIVLAVGAGAYTDNVYTIDGEVVTPTPVLTDGGKVKFIKIEAPAGVTSLTLQATKGGRPVLNSEVSLAPGSVAAPAVLYGETSMTFSDYYHDVTADITAIRPASTVFAKTGEVAEPEYFITAGTRTGGTDGTQYPKWVDTDEEDRVDTVSSATYGDNPHFVPTGNLAINYDDPMTKADGHEITGIKKVEVGVDFDLFANAALLRAAGEEIETADAVWEKVAAISSWKGAGEIYKAKYLQPDGAWGKRDQDPLNGSVVGTWPKTPVTSVSYGGTWADKVIAADFGPLTAPLDSAGLWSTYFEKLYGGYVVDSTGHKEPLVWLQNLFSHRGHTNFEVALNRAGISRMDDLTPEGVIHVVIFAYGLPDIIFDQAVVGYEDSEASIEQGSVFYAQGTGGGATFKNSTGLDIPKVLHVTGLSAAALSDFAANGGVLKKGTADVPNVGNAAYELALEEADGEIAITLKDGFFAAGYQGAYSLSITSGTVYKTPTFTVNQIIARPKLARSGDSGNWVDANTATATIDVLKSETIAFNNDDFAKAIVLSGRTFSSIVKESGDADALPAITAVLTRATGADPYTIKASVLTGTAGRIYKLTIVTSNFASAVSTNLNSVVYYIKVTD